MRTLIKTIMALMLVGSISSMACERGDQMAIKDSRGTQIGIIYKSFSSPIQIVPNQGEYFISGGGIEFNGRQLRSFVSIPGSLIKIAVIDPTLYDKNSVVKFSLVNHARQHVGNYSTTLHALKRVTRSVGCGGELAPQ